MTRPFSLNATVLLVSTFVGAVHASDPQPNQIQDLKRLSIEELMQLDVTSVSRRPERIVETPAAVSVITAEDIRRAGASTLPDALRLADGAMVARFNGGAWGVSVRGFTSTANNKLLVQVDGRSVYTQLFGGVFWETIDYPLADIERIEVIRGPAGTLWGPNATNGVINIITKRAADTQGAHLSVEGGSREPGGGVFRYGGSIGAQGTYRVYGKASHFASPQFASGTSVGEDRSIYQTGFRADFGSSPARSMIVQGDMSYGRFGLADRPDSEHWNGNLLFRWTRQARPGSSFDVLTYVDHGHREVPRQSWETRTIYDVEAQHNLDVGRRHRVVWGGGFRATSDQTRPTPVLFFDPQDRNIYQGDAFAQDEIALRPDRLFLTVGSRVEQTTFSGFEVQPSARVRYSATTTVMLWGAISRATRTPTRFDQDLRIQIGPVVAIRGDRDFRSEQLVACEAGMRLRPTAQVSLDVAGFFHDYDDLRSQEPTAPAGFPIVLRNLYQGHTAGVDLSVNVQPLPIWLLHAGYIHGKRSSSVLARTAAT